MEQQDRLYLFLFAMGIIAAIVIFYLIKSTRKSKKELAEIKENYDNAIRTGDKAKALEWGREYYKTMRGGILSIYDEQAITNDLSTIK